MGSQKVWRFKSSMETQVLVYYPNTKKEARESGFKFYFTGKPCKWGHRSLRYTSTNQCIKCSRGYAKNWKSDNRNAFLKNLSDYKKKHRWDFTHMKKTAPGT